MSSSPPNTGDNLDPYDQSLDHDARGTGDRIVEIPEIEAAIRRIAKEVNDAVDVMKPHIKDGEGLGDYRDAIAEQVLGRIGKALKTAP